MDKEHHRASRKCQREKTPETPPRAGATRSPRRRPPSSAIAAVNQVKKKSPAPPRRSAATRQWINTTTRQPEMSEREKTPETPLRRIDRAAFGHDDPVAHRRRPLRALSAPPCSSATPPSFDYPPKAERLPRPLTTGSLTQVRVINQQ